jgi:hypothetical protein
LVSSDPSIVVEALFRRNAGGVYWEAGEPASPGLTGFLIPFDATTFAPGEPFYTGFGIANLDSVNNATITCTAWGSSGNQISAPFSGSNIQGPLSSHSLTLVPLGHTAGFVFPALAGQRGTLSCSSTTKISVVALRFYGDTVSSLAVIPKQ